MNQLGGLARRMPRTTVVWLISVGSMMGVPFMSGFASKWLLYTAALQAGQVVPALAAWVVSVGTVFSCVKATSCVFLGPTTPQSREARMKRRRPWSGRSGLFALGSVVLGRGAAVGRQLHHQSDPAPSRHGHRAGLLVWPDACRRFLVDHRRPDASCRLRRRRRCSLLTGRFIPRAALLAVGQQLP